MKNILIVALIQMGLLSTGCLAASDSYIGYYNIASKKGSKAQPREEMKTIAQKISHDLHYKLEVIDDSNAVSQLVLMPNAESKTTNAPRIVLTCQNEAEYTISVIKNGRNENEPIHLARKSIEAALEKAAYGRWTFSLAHSSLAR